MGHKPTLAEKAAEKSGKTLKNILHWQWVAVFLAFFDVVVVNLSYFAALWLRFDGSFGEIPKNYLDTWLHFTPWYTLACVAVFFVLRLYQSIWRFASFNELVRLVIAAVVTSAIHVGGTLLFFIRMPLSYYFLGAGIQFLLLVGIRFSYRLVLLLRSILSASQGVGKIRRVMLVGAGNAGEMILHDIQSAKNSGIRVCCIIDDNPNKWRRYIDGIPVVGGRDDILVSAKEYEIDEIYLAVPSASPEQRRDILNICKETGCKLKNLPGMYQFMEGKISVGAMQDVAVEDLLGREPIRVNMDEIFLHLRDKTILVTGGGGSIGSELCRQIARHSPKLLIIFDVYENNAYEIEQELRGKYPALNLQVLIGSVRDSRRIQQVFETYKPQIVYHAAAHKHVPLMETSPCESIKNNAIGTYKTAYAAMLNGCERFVLISTDKAVNPTNIMGASKRLCEMVIQSFDSMLRQGRGHELPCLHAHAADEFSGMKDAAARCADARTEFVAVRFGNVLGSNGSVIPLFKKQIAKGGPVTETHPDIIRYFMTIPEAVSLVLQAGTYARGGEIFVLDMGAPVKIDTLARNLIKLSGFQPDVDILISYTGLRPGEKLYEEKLMNEEGMKTTPNKLIHIGSPIPFDTDVFLAQLQKLMDACYENREDIRELVEEMVPTYHPAGSQGSEQKGKAYEEQLRQMAGIK